MLRGVLTKTIVCEGAFTSSVFPFCFVFFFVLLYYFFFSITIAINKLKGTKNYCCETLFDVAGARLPPFCVVRASVEGTADVNDFNGHKLAFKTAVPNNPHPSSRNPIPGNWVHLSNGEREEGGGGVTTPCILYSSVCVCVCVYRIDIYFDCSQCQTNL